MKKSPVRLALSWSDALVFRAEAHGGRELMIDGDSHRSFSPVELLAAAVTSCMAADIVHILRTAREPLDGLRASFNGLRASSDPHRFIEMRFDFTVEGRIDPSRVDRAVQLSKDKYCSVLNTLREDVSLEFRSRVETERTAP